MKDEMLGRSVLQPSLTVSTPGDPFELEADRVADEVMRMPDAGAVTPAVHPVPTPGLHRKCASCTATDNAGDDVSSTVARVTSSGGQSLDDGTRAFMESRFGRDLGHVRVHTGSDAAASASSLGAAAYTVGGDIVFGDGRYAPHSNSGRRIIAHELAHTIQQAGGQPAAVQRVAAAPSISTGAHGIVQMVGECAGKSKGGCNGSCIPSSGKGTGFCRWSGTIKYGCVCIAADQPMLREFQEALYNALIALLIAAGIVLTAVAIAAIIACFMGPCEVAALIAAVGFAGAMIVIGFLRANGMGDAGSTAAAGDSGDNAPPAGGDDGATATA